MSDLPSGYTYTPPVEPEKPAEEYTLVSHKESGSGMVFKRHRVPDYASDATKYATFDIPVEHNAIARSLADTDPTIVGTFVNDSYEIDFTSDALAAFKRRRDIEPLVRMRNQRLAESDWTQMPDSPLTDEKKATWAVYRQALRDFPNTYTGEPDANWRSVFPSPPV